MKYIKFENGMTFIDTAEMYGNAIAFARTDS